MKVSVEHYGHVNTLLSKFEITMANFIKLGSLAITGFSFIYCWLVLLKSNSNLRTCKLKEFQSFKQDLVRTKAF